MWKDKEEAKRKMREYRRRKIANGICEKCAKPATMGILCEYHGKKQRIRSRLGERKKHGFAPAYSLFPHVGYLDKIDPMQLPRDEFIAWVMRTQFEPDMNCSFLISLNGYSLENERDYERGKIDGQVLGDFRDPLTLLLEQEQEAT